MTEMSLFDLYALFCVKGIGNRKLNRILKSETGKFQNIENIMTRTVEEITEILPAINKKDADSLKNLDLETVQTEYEQLSLAGVDIIAANSDNFPRTLNDKLDLDAPPLLFCSGRLDIITSSAISIVGSRDISYRGRDITIRLVGKMAGKNVTIISGGAKGIDATAHNAAVDCGLNTIIVVPYGMNRVLTGAANDPIPGNALFISQFHPNSNWSTAFAMIRNKTVCALSKAIFVVEAGESGGTINTGQSALEMEIPLYVISPDEYKIPPSGNRYLISKGGRELSLESALDSINDLIS